VTSADDLELRERQLIRFRRLFAELLRGKLNRNSFAPWEIDLLIDFETCWLPPRRRTEILHQYQRAVIRQVESGAGPPMKLSRFLALREQRRCAAPALRQ
jgi:hypothetical protein